MKLISCQLKCGKNEKETKLVVSNLKNAKNTSKFWNLVEGIKLAAPCKLCVEHLWAGFNSTYKRNQTKLMHLDFIKKDDAFGIKLVVGTRSINSCNIS